MSYQPIVIDRENKKSGILGKELASIYQIDGVPTIQQLYSIKVGDEKEPEEDLYTKLWGQKLQPFMADWFVKTFDENKRWIESNLGETVTKVEINEIDEMYQHPQYPFMQADVSYLVCLETVDGRVLKGVCLCKSPSYNDFENWGWDEVPVEVELEARHNMAVMNVDYAIVLCVVGNNIADYCAAIITRDAEKEKEIIKKEETFWNNHVIPKKMPEYEGCEGADDTFFENAINRAFIKGKIKNPTKVKSKYLNAAKEYAALKKKVKLLEKRSAEYKDAATSYKVALMEAMANQNNLERRTLSEHVYVSLRTSKQTRVDSERIKRERNDLYQQYLKETLIERFDVEVEEKMPEN